jgi:hypothetical protein
MSAHGKHRDEDRLDQSVEMTFPASDPAAHGGATGTEPPYRPVDREPPQITAEQIEQARRGEGHKLQEPSTGAEATVLGGSEPVDQPDRQTVEVRQGTGPRATVSVLLVSILLAACAGIALAGYFLWTGA